MDLIASLTSSLALVSATSVTSPHVSPIVTDAQELSDFSWSMSTRESLTTAKYDERNDMKILEVRRSKLSCDDVTHRQD